MKTLIFYVANVQKHVDGIDAVTSGLRIIGG
jgi:hypothetical protein